MAKVLMINPVIREEDVPKHIPYGISELAAIAVEKGHLVQIYDENAWRKGPEVMAQVCVADEWDVIAIGGLTTAYNSIKNTVKIARRVAPKAFIIAGGGFLTSMPKDIMTWLPEIDLGVIGEAYVTWPEVLAMIDNNNFDFSKTLGVCHRTKEGKIVINGVRPNIHDLDTLPYPAWDLLPLEIYFKNSQLLYSEASFASKRRIDVGASLGCGMVCKFCFHLGITGDMVVEKDENGNNDVRFTYGRNIRYHTPEYVIKMVKALVERYQVDFISFIDENLMTMDVASSRTWLRELCELWIKEGLQPHSRRDGTPDEKNTGGVFWSGTSHASLANKEILDLMYKAGCSHLVYGIESFDPTILKNLGKGVNQKHNIQAVQTCMESKIIPIPNIIIGFPLETFQSVRTTIEWLIKLGIHCKPHFATPYPGSEWYYTYRDSILQQYSGDLEAFIKELGDASSISAVISHKFSPVQLLGLQQIVMSRNMRLLDLTEKHWGGADALISPLVQAKESFNIVKKKVQAPIEEAPVSVQG
ncbi:MAG: B12-binding domain-containing radical SAM protein [Candidatus Omnitrophica bacterium]|nr:B12-binding domain-containing radical SAM protein [Candidatus Omnitrophota bacterium]